MNGTLALPAPGVDIPVLPCDDNRLVVVLPNRTVDAQCVDVSGDPLGLGLVFGGNSSGLRSGFTMGPLAVSAQGDTILSITYTAPLVDANTGARTWFKCVGAACAGATFGPPTINSDLGVDVTIRRLTVTGLQLPAVQADGTPAALAPAMVDGVFSTADYQQPSLYTPAELDCSAALDRLQTTFSDLAAPADFCTVADGKTTSLLDDGTVLYHAGPAFVSGNLPAPALDLRVVDGVVLQVDATVFFYSNYRCAGDCTGITIGAPDGSGQRVITFTGTVLHQLEPADLPGDLTLTLDGSYIAPAPTPP